MDDFPLVYHFTGAPIPKWALPTLREAPSRWRGPVVVLHDQDEPPTFAGVAFVDIRPWYDPEPFNKFATAFGRPAEFRNGFWFHAVERFFVLSQWSEYSATSRFLHCELDVLLMVRSEFSRPVWPPAEGVMYPRASPTNAGANVLYVNGRGALTPLLDFFVKNSGDEFEMELLAKFLDEFPSDARALPSHFTLDKDANGDETAASISLSEFGGVVDVHPIGTWIFGQDPRNVKTGPVFNHFYYPDIGSPFVEHLRYFLERGTNQLFVRNVDGSEWPVFAVHVHSKLMHLAHSPTGLRLFVWLANRPGKSLVIVQHLDKAPRHLVRKLIDGLFRLVVRPLRKLRASHRSRAGVVGGGRRGG